MLNNKSILITGGTGSFGKKFIQTVLERYEPKKVIVYSRDKFKQFEMQHKWPDGGIMRYFIGDVGDYHRLKMAMTGVDIVVHAAALKQVPAAEYNPFEAVKTNLLGGQNVIDAAISKEVSHVIIFDKPEIPIYPIKPKKKRTVIYEGLLGITIGIILGFIREYINNQTEGDRKSFIEIKTILFKKLKEMLRLDFK